MSKRYSLGVLLLTLLASFNVLAQGLPTANAVFRKGSASIGVIRTFDASGGPLGQGSGVVTASREVASNCHVIEGAHSAVFVRSSVEIKLTLIAADPDRDLCIFGTAEDMTGLATIGRALGVEVGDRVYAIGAPRGYELSLSDGIISSVRPVEGGLVLQTTAPISKGSSGGGLFDEDGTLIGITTAYVGESQQLNFAIPAEWIDVLRRRPRPPAAAPATAASDSTPTLAERPGKGSSRLRTDVQAIEFSYTYGLEHQGGLHPVRDAAFLASESIVASVTTQSSPGMAANIIARWSFQDGQLVDQSAPIALSGGLETTVFTIDNPDPWPVGTYSLQVLVGGALAHTSSFSVKDGVRRRVEGVVFSYMLDGVRHYAAKKPPRSDDNSLRSIPYSFYELIAPSND